jgi:hypothetical protein
LSDGILPEFGIYLLGKRPQQMVWDARWVRWPDLWLPADRRDAQDALREGWSRARAERVEIACGGGRGRTGTALACLAVLDGVPADDAVAYVRKHYDPRAAETPWQRYYVTRFPALEGVLPAEPRPRDARPLERPRGSAFDECPARPTP